MPVQPHKPLPGQRKKQRKLLGAPISWSDSDIEQLSAVTPADLKTAAALWQNEAPTALRELLSAQVEEGQ